MRKLWQRFWFEPTSPASLALFRIGFGILVLQVLLVPIGSSLHDWLGHFPLAPLELVQKIVWRGEPRYDCFQLLSGNDALTVVYFYSLVVAAAAVCLGFLTQFNTAYLALGLISFDNHVAVVFPEGSDTLLRLCAIFLAFSPAGAMYSLDSLFSRHKEKPVLTWPWAQRMIQLQLCFIYGETGFTKMLVPQWWDGSYLYYTMHLEEMTRLPAFGFFDNIWLLKFSSWYTMFVELSMAILIWVKPIRYYVLGAILLLHLFIALFIYLPFFEETFVWTLIVFIYPADTERLVAKLKGLIFGLKFSHS